MIAPTTSGTAVVASFGDDGWGTLDLGAEVIPFHSTAIVDGSRTIGVGARVRCRIVPGRAGRWEATDVAEI